MCQDLSRGPHAFAQSLPGALEQILCQDVSNLAFPQKRSLCFHGAIGFQFMTFFSCGSVKHAMQWFVSYTYTVKFSLQ